MSSYGYGPVKPFVVLGPALTDETLGLPIDATGRNFHTFYITGTGTVSSGILTIEEAPTTDYAGTWASITTVDVSSVTVSAGACGAVHLTAGCYGALRCRISTVIGGTGTITVKYAGN